MSETHFPPFFKISSCKSTDEKEPDVLIITPLDQDTFETDYGICQRCNINGSEYALNIYSFNSQNKKLLNLWNDATKKNKIKVGKEFSALTWLRPSKQNSDRNVRDWKLVF